MIDRVVLFSIPIQELKEIIGEILEEKLKGFNLKAAPTSPTQKEFLTTKEVCLILHISPTTLWHYTREGKLISHRIGRRRLFRYDELKDTIINNGVQVSTSLAPDGKPIRVRK